MFFVCLHDCLVILRGGLCGSGSMDGLAVDDQTAIQIKARMSRIACVVCSVFGSCPALVLAPEVIIDHISE